MSLVFLTFGAEWRTVSAVNDHAEGMNSGGVLGLPQGDGFFGVSWDPFLSQEIPTLGRLECGPRFQHQAEQPTPDT